jgi:hypothetical protein
LLAGASGNGGAHFCFMAARGLAENKIPKTRRVASRTERRRQRISKILSEIEARLDFTTNKVTLADFIRLTQLERELEDEEQPREIIVTWKEPAEKRCESK